VLVRMTAKNCFETDDQQLRFQAEQEFVQCLGDPNYLNFLAQRGYFKEKDQQRLRFQIELEFVQCLGNPNYLHFLAQCGYFKDKAFINYLRYLQYWKEPEYSRFLKYPMCLYFLDLLQYEHFRREIVNTHSAKFINDQEILFWQHYARKRTMYLTQIEPKLKQANTNNAKQGRHIGEEGMLEILWRVEILLGISRITLYHIIFDHDSSSLQTCTNK
ncbi:unnamed protein product, partial [Timema podura]|nr:unnamed protein product [Timema podura]